MSEQTYLQWLAEHTNTQWWNDSGDSTEIARAIDDGAVGITTNPVLCATVVNLHPSKWNQRLKDIAGRSANKTAKAGELVRLVVTEGAKQLRSIYDQSAGEYGYICAQVNPGLAGNREKMMEAAREFTAWAPNVSVKLPATKAGLEVLEDAVAEGISVTGTVSFTLPQLLGIAEAHARGSTRAKEQGKTPGKCVAVVMVGRIDDYLREVAADNTLPISENYIRQAGTAVVKRGYEIFRQKGYEAKICIAALRGTYHAVNLAGADIIMSIHPKIQKVMREESVPRGEFYAKPVPAEAVEHLSTIPEFRRAYQPDGLSTEEFITYGATQRTLSQFLETGWNRLESFHY